MLLQVINTVIDELVQMAGAESVDKERIMQPASLLLFIGELIRSYASVTHTILNAKHNDKPFLQWVSD